MGVELRDKVIGVVGLGQIGKGVAKRAKSFGMKVIAYDTYQDKSFAASWGVDYLALEEVLCLADFLTLHAPVTNETRHLLSKTQLSQMKSTAYLINTARGELINEAALYDALASGALAGAASDVFQKEPPGSHPLLELPTFIAMPHSAGQTHEGLRKMGEITAENALRVLRNEKPLYRAV